MTENGDAETQTASDLQLVPEALPNSKFKLEFVFGPHTTAQEADIIAEPLKECDIYIPEMIGWDSAVLEGLNSVAQGTLTAEEAVKKYGNRIYDGFFKQLLDHLHNSRKKVAFIDVPADHDLDIRIRSKKIPNRQASFEEDVNAQLKYLQREEKTEEEREDYMADQLPAVLSQLVEGNPELKNKEHVRVLILLGAAHTGVLHRLKKRGYDVDKSVFPSSTYRFGFYGNEVQRRLAFSKPLDMLLVARSLMERYMGKALAKQHIATYCYLPSDTTKAASLLKRLIDPLSYDELKAIWEEGGNFFGILPPFEDRLKEKGMALPRSEKELDDFLASPV